MNAFCAAVGQGCHRQLQFSDSLVLLSQGKVVAFDQGVFKGRHIIIVDAVPIQGIDADPHARLRVIISKDSANVAIALFQLRDKGAARPARIATIGRNEFVRIVFLHAFVDVADVIRGVEECPKKCDDFLDRFPVPLWFPKGFPFEEFGVDDDPA